MNRRSFLSMVGFVAPVAVVKPTYFFAPPGGWGVKLYATIGAWADYPLPYDHNLLGKELSDRMRFTIDTLARLEVDSESA